MTDNEIIKAWDILAKLDFFGGQRAGRELWGKKPVDVQNEDIENFSMDVAWLKDFINCQMEKIERYEKENNEKFNKWMLLDERTKERYAELYEEAKGVVRAEAIKEFAERAFKMITEVYDKHIFGNNDLEDEEKEAIINFSDDVTFEIDNLLKEMTGEPVTK